MSSHEQPIESSEPLQGATDTSYPSQPPPMAPSVPDDDASHLQTQTPMSKNALKRLRKQQEWESGREDRRLKRKEKRQTHKLRVRAERAALIAGGADPRAVYNRDKRAPVLVPVTIVIDCDFEQYMTDKERISLSSQVTRAYSDNRNAKYRSHLWIAGFRGKLADRFNNVLQAQQNSWKGASVFAGDFAACAAEARAQMTVKPTATTPAAGEDATDEQNQNQQQQPQQQQLIGPLQRSLEHPVPWPRDAQDPFPLPDAEPPLDPAYQDVVYLSSDSPYTLSRLEPNTTYVVGGLVDKNREKGLCYRRARERGIRTARLPIGQFMVMQSRQVLATNHVVDIMLKWLEFEDWGQAFLSVIPKRKGGKLREADGGEEEENGEAEEQAEEENGEQAAEEAPKEGTAAA